MSGFQISQRDLSDLRGAMKRVEKKMRVIGFDLIKATANKFITSATVATKPGSKGKISGNSLPAKARLRPIVTLTKKTQKQKGKFYYYNTKDNNIRVLSQYITPKKADKQGLFQITKFFEAISRKTGKPYYIPIKPGDDRNSSKKRRIPKAGAGKAGWLGHRKNIDGKGSTGMRGISSKVAKTNVQKKITDPFIEMINNVRYISKIAPNSARIGLQKAGRALEQQYLPKAERVLKSDKDLT